MKYLKKKKKKVSICLGGTVSKPVCDEWPVSCFLLSCQLSGPDKEDSSCHKERGNLRLHAGLGSLHPHASNPQPSRNPLQRSATGASVSTVWDVQQNLIHKYRNTQTSPLLAPQWHPHLNHALLGHIRVHACVAISSWTLLLKLEHNVNTLADIPVSS